MYIKNFAIVFISVVFSFSATFALAQDSVGEEYASTESHLLFLRDTTVLLQKGDQRIGTAFSLMNDEQKVFSTLASQRTFSLTLSYSMGVGYGSEMFISVPASYTKTKQRDFLFSENNTEKTHSAFESVSVGVKKTLMAQGAEYPELVGALSISSPLGDEIDGQRKDTTVTLGATVIKSIDPVVLYGGASYTHTLGNENNSYGLRLGSAFAVNHKIAFGGELSMGREFGYNMTLSPVSILTFRETYSASKKISIEPSLAIGLSDSAPDTIFGLAFSWSY